MPGDAPGCYNLGVDYTNGLGVEKNPATAVPLYRKACDGGQAAGCSNLGVLYDEGSGVEKDSAVAVGLYKRACDCGNAESCATCWVCAMPAARASRRTQPPPLPSTRALAARARTLLLQPGHRLRQRRGRRQGSGHGGGVVQEGLRRRVRDGCNNLGQLQEKRRWHREEPCDCLLFLQAGLRQGVNRRVQQPGSCVRLR